MTTNQQWHDERRKGIGGSDSAAALGLSEWREPFELYLEKIGEAELREPTEQMLFGNLLEPIVREEYVRRTGNDVVFGQPAVVSEQYPWMRVNLDGMISPELIFEAKTARSDAGWGEPGSDDIPQDYILQNQHAMIVTGAVVVDVAVLIAGSDFRIYRQEHNPMLAELVIEGEREFWRHVETRTPPEPKTLKAINLRWRSADPRKVELSPEGADAVRKLAVIKRQIETLKIDADTCEMAIKIELREADVATVDGVVAVTWQQAKDGRAVDWKKLEAEHPAIVAHYTTSKAGSRRFLLKGQEK